MQYNYKSVYKRQYNYDQPGGTLYIRNKSYFLLTEKSFTAFWTMYTAQAAPVILFKDLAKISPLPIPHTRQGRIQGGGRVLRVRTPPPPFGRPPNFKIKRGKTLRACAQIHRILVLNCYPNPTPLSEILYPPLRGFELGLGVGVR